MCLHELSHNCQLIVAITMFPLHLQLQKSYNKNQQNSSLMDGWKTTLTWHYNNSCKLVPLELYNSCSCTIKIEFHKLQMYTVSFTMSYIYCNSCNFFNNIQPIKIQWMIIAIQKQNSKISCKSTFFVIVIALWHKK